MLLRFFKLQSKLWQTLNEIQRRTKCCAPGLVKFVPAVAILTCRALPGSFLTIFANHFVLLCRYHMSLTITETTPLCVTLVRFHVLSVLINKRENVSQKSLKKSAIQAPTHPQAPHTRRGPFLWDMFDILGCESYHGQQPEYRHMTRRRAGYLLHLTSTPCTDTKSTLYCTLLHNPYYTKGRTL